MDADTALKTRLLQLRALRVVDVEGWARYVAGDLAASRHVLQLDDGSPRVLEPGEAWWWARGIADAYGHGHLITALEHETQPALLTVQEAAELLPQGQRGGSRMTFKGVEHLIHTGQLYTIHGPTRRHVFRAQVDALAATRLADRDPADQQLRETARGQQLTWAQVRSLYPPATRIVDLAEGLHPKPSPDPLPIPAGVHAQQRRLQALMTAHQQGWVVYQRPDKGGYVVTVTDVAGTVVQVDRIIPAGGVLPWVLGLADYHGQSKLIAYRPGLG